MDIALDQVSRNISLISHHNYHLSLTSPLLLSACLNLTRSLSILFWTSACE